MRRLVLVRHGESGWNADGRIQGQLGEGLSERGHAQARHTAAWLAETHPDAVVATSDLERTRQTAAPLEERLGRDALVEPGLRELDFGTWSGKRGADLQVAEPDRWRRWSEGEDVVHEVGGEDRESFTRRVVDAYERLLAGIPTEGTLVCITHGGPIWFGVRALLDLHEEVLGSLANASITELLVDDAFGMRLGAWNQTAHLPVDLRTTTRWVERLRRS